MYTVNCSAIGQPKYQKCTRKVAYPLEGNEECLALWSQLKGLGQVFPIPPKNLLLKYVGKLISYC